jgi:hypothetical protein
LVLAIRWTLVLLAVMAFPPAIAEAASVPSDFDDRRVASLPAPTSLAPLPDGRLLL